jgi:hypothetical protein
MTCQLLCIKIMELISGAFRLEFREFCVGLFLRQIEDIFQMADIQRGAIPPNRNVSGQRRTLVEEYYASIDWVNSLDVQKFLKAVWLIISQTYIGKEGKEFLLELCKKEGLVIKEHQIELSNEMLGLERDLFRSQFPGGLPFGKFKPDFSVTTARGSQSLKFEWNHGLGIIWKDVYPCYDFQSFQTALGITSDTNLPLKKSLLAMNQTESEKLFFQAYAKHFAMADQHVPLLVPQAWIQWHSSLKKDLIARKSPMANELYRVDFVAFWENQRYAILIDDIGHYAVKRGGQWVADEETYSKRLEEDRRLQIEGWRIFRISNWEIRDANRLGEILASLQKMLIF